MRKFWKRYWGFARCSIEMRMAYRMGFFFNWLSSLVGLIVSIFCGVCCSRPRVPYRDMTGTR